MIIFRVIAEPDGWYVCTGGARSGPCLSRALAVERAQGMVDALSRFGEEARVEAGSEAPAKPCGRRSDLQLSRV
jgi:hypothetical protein